MEIFGASVAVNLGRKTDGTIELKSQEPGMIKGLLNEAIGMVDGGLSTSVGASHTVGEVAKIAIGTKFADNIRDFPVVGKFLS